MAQFVTRLLGLTRFGKLGQGPTNWVHVTAKTLPNSPSGIILDATADTTGAVTSYFLWVDTNGKLRIGTAIPTDQDGSGTAVGPP
jgi:hypothetical protein